MERIATSLLVAAVAVLGLPVDRAPAKSPEKESVNITQLEAEIKAKQALLDQLKSAPQQPAGLIDSVKERNRKLGRTRRSRRVRRGYEDEAEALSMLGSGPFQKVSQMHPVVIYKEGKKPEDENETEPVLKGEGDHHPDPLEYKEATDPIEICIPTEKVDEKKCEDKPFIFDRERVWHFGFRETTGDWDEGSRNCHKWTRCGGKIEFCYYTGTAKDFYDYSTYSWPKVQQNGYLGDSRALKRPMFGNAGTFHSACCDCWTDPLHKNYSAVQGWVLYPLKGLKYKQAPSITLYGNFSHAVPPSVMDRWVEAGNGSLASGVVEWMLVHSMSGGNSDATVLRSGAIEIGPTGNLTFTKDPENDLQVANVTIPCFDTGHIAFWTKATFLDPDFSSNKTAPTLLSLADDIKFVVHHKNNTDLTVPYESWPQPDSFIAQPCRGTVDLPLPKKPKGVQRVF